MSIASKRPASEMPNSRAARRPSVSFGDVQHLGPGGRRTGRRPPHILRFAIQNSSYAIAEQRTEPVRIAEGWSMHWAWHAETTFWLRALDAACVRMSDYHGREDRPNPSGKPQRTFPPYRPPDDGRGISCSGSTNRAKIRRIFWCFSRRHSGKRCSPCRNVAGKTIFRVVVFQTRPAAMATRVFRMLAPTHFHHGDSPYRRFSWSGSSRRGC